MIIAAGCGGRRVGVLGLGRSGLASVRALLAGGAEVVAWDDRPGARAAAEAEGALITDLSVPGAVDGLAGLVTSPGIAHLYPAPHPAIAAAQAALVPVDNEIGLFFAALGRGEWAAFGRAPRVVAVTGTNGKSTTAALIHHVLTAAGRAAQLGGNIGRPALDLDPPGDGEVVVLELSSYQIELARALTPDIAVFLNLSDDHLDRHGGRGGYFAAKRRLFAEGGPDHAVIGIDEAEGRFLAAQIAEGAGDDRLIRVGRGKADGAGWQVRLRKGWLSEWRRGRQAASVDLRQMAGLAGAHNHQNAGAAHAVLRALGLGPREIARHMDSFPGLAHRSQLVAEIGGVRFVNDSKATNPSAAAQALGAFERVRWICGGKMKEGGLGPLQGALGHVRKAYVIGADPGPFAAALGDLPRQITGTMRAAVAAAAAEAEAGDVVLLAPACASFDQYPDFEARGEDFAAAVRALPGAEG